MTTFAPIPLAVVEDGAITVAADPNARGEVLLRVLERGWPLEQRLESGVAGSDDLRARAAAIAADPDAACPAAWPLPAAPADALVSVVVCTLGRDDRLPHVARAVLGQTHRALELIVVDNDPSSGAVPRLLEAIDDDRLAIVAEPRRGLSAARNAGLARARGEVVAFTDDDALPHRGWIDALVRAFAADRRGAVACVTGLVLPEGFATEAQLLFEQCAGFAKGFRAMWWGAGSPDGPLGDLAEPGRRGAAFPYSGGEFGSGNNMAFRTAALRELGGFDLALGAGAMTRGGEDLDVFRRTYLAGGQIVYLPAALVGHHHRADLDALTRQMYAYGTGMSAVVTKVVMNGGARPILRRLPRSLALLLRADSPKNERKGPAFPRAVTRAELRGYLHGPLLYARARRAAGGAR